MLPDDRPPPSRPRVLIVDDEPSVLVALVALFRVRGADSRGAPSPVEALLILENERFDVLVTDVGLGGEADGHWLLRHATEEWPNMQRYLMSAEPHRTHHVFLLKPFGVEEIDRILRATAGPRAS